MKIVYFSFYFSRVGGPIKNALSYDSLGLLIGTDSGNAQRNFERYLSILESALLELGTMPKRAFKNMDDFESYFKEHKDLILDATEHPTQRPKGYDAQKEVYSGKKDTHKQRTYN